MGTKPRKANTKPSTPLGDLSDRSPTHSSNQHISLSFLQINLGRCKRALDNLLIEIFDIAIIFEPPVGRDGLIGSTPNYWCFQKKSPSSHVKSAILISKTLNGILLDASNPNNVFVGFKFGVKEFNIASVYLEPDGDIESQLIPLSNFTASSTQPILIGGDFNGHSPTWGSPHSNDRGIVVGDFITSNDLTLLNDGNMPTFEARRNGEHITSIVDLTIASWSIASLVAD